MPIRVMDPQLAAKIAAGEVVERPASIVKELVENSLDAQATQIEIEAKQGGIQAIRVMDDGVGIPVDELPLAFERYATSKLSRAEDLQRVESMGFRGEALPSVAAVSHVLCISRPAGQDRAAYIRVEYGKVTETGYQGAPAGTTVIVRDLFLRFPARLKFLKSASAEGAAISRAVTHLALAFPDVAFRLIMNGRLLFHSPGNGDVRDTLVEAYGVETAQELLAVDDSGWSGPVRVSGFISPASLTRARRDQQAFFVNRRWVQSRLLSHALDDFYRSVLPRGRHPIAALFLTLPTVDVDVNVHPTKAEVRLRRTREVFSAVQRALRQTWAERDPTLAAPADEAESGARFSSLAIGGEEAAPPQALFSVPSTSSRSVGRGPGPEAALVLRPVGQVGTTYIVAEGPDGMYLIDQHAAHERLVFDALLSARGAVGPEVQGLLEPQVMALSRAHVASLEDARGEVEAFGFQWEPFGEETILLRAVPSGLREGEAPQTLLEVLDELAQEQGPSHDRDQTIAASVACHSTVRAGQVLSMQEMDSLLRQMAEAGFPRLCPHGRPTLMHLSAAQIDKNFLRR